MSHDICIRYAKKDHALYKAYQAFQQKGINLHLQSINKGLFDKGYVLSYDSDTAEARIAKNKAYIKEKDLLKGFSDNDKKVKDIIIHMYARKVSTFNIGCFVVLGIILVLGFISVSQNVSVIWIPVFIGVCIGAVLNFFNDFKSSRYEIEGTNMWKNKDVKDCQSLLKTNQ